MIVPYYLVVLALALMESTTTPVTALDQVTLDRHVQMTLMNVILSNPVIPMPLPSVLTMPGLISVSVNKDLTARTVIRILMTVVVIPAKMEVCVSHIQYFFIEFSSNTFKFYLNFVKNNCTNAWLHMIQELQSYFFVVCKFCYCNHHLEQ